MKKVNLLNAVSTIVMVLSFAKPVLAQQMDYGSLEGLFGEPVTTSATGKPQRASESPVNMEIISADDIRRTGARTIPEALSGVTGLDVWQSGGNGFDIGIRGSNAYFNPSVLVMINGRQVYNDSYGYTAWQSLPVSMKEILQIEVVKGPNAALFGFNAVAGVINIITYNPQYDQINSVDATVGTASNYRGSIINTIPVGKESGVRMSAKGFSGNDFKDGHFVNDVYQDKNQARAANVDGRFKIGDKTTLALQGGHSVSSTNSLSRIYVISRNDIETDTVGASLDHETENWGLLHFSLYHNALSEEIDSLLGSGFDSNNKVTVAKLQDLFKVGAKHTFRIGGEYRNNWVENVPLGTGELSYDNYALSGMWDWSILDNLNWTNAARIDRLFLNRSGVFNTSNPYTNDDYTKNLKAYSFNSGLVYKPTEDNSVSVSYGRGILLPSLYSFGALDKTLGPLYLGGRPDIKPTVASNYEIDFSQNLPSFQASDVNFDTNLKVALFHKTYQDMVCFVKSPAFPSIAPLTFLYENCGSSKSTGLELGIKGKVNDEWRWGANYTYQTTSDDMVKNSSGVVIYDEQYEKSDPRHLANFNLGYTKDKWEGDAYLHFVSARKMFRDTTPLIPLSTGVLSTDVVYSLSGRLAYKVNDNMTLSVNGTNLLSPQAKQTTGAKVERSVWFGVTWDY